MKYFLSNITDSLYRLVGIKFDQVLFPRIRALLLRLALGSRQFDYMVRSIKNDKRTPHARLVDIVVRQDAREVRTEADWVKYIAKVVAHVEPKSLVVKVKAKSV